MNPNLRKNLYELNELLRYFSQRMENYRRQGIVTPVFEVFVSECHGLSEKVTGVISVTDKQADKLESLVAPQIEKIKCSGCGTRAAMTESGEYYHHLGWKSNLYTCPKCGEETKGLQPNNLPDVFSFLDLCEREFEEKIGTLSAEDHKELALIARKLRKGFSSFITLKDELLDALENQRDAENELAKRLAEYANVLRLEKYRLVTGTDIIGSC